MIWGNLLSSLRSFFCMWNVDYFTHLIELLENWNEIIYAPTCYLFALSWVPQLYLEVRGRKETLLKHFIFQPPLNLEVAMWLSSGQWDASINISWQLLRIFLCPFHLCPFTFPILSLLSPCFLECGYDGYCFVPWGRVPHHGEGGCDPEGLGRAKPGHQPWATHLYTFLGGRNKHWCCVSHCFGLLFPIS